MVSWIIEIINKKAGNTGALFGTDSLKRNDVLLIQLLLLKGKFTPIDLYNSFQRNYQSIISFTIFICNVDINM